MGQPTKRIKIERITPAVGMDSSSAERTSSKVQEDALQRIYSRNSSSLSIQEVQKQVQNMILDTYGSKQNPGLVNTVTQRLHEVATAVESATRELLLEELSNRWMEYNIVWKMLGDVLQPLDSKDLEIPSKALTFQLGLNLWSVTILQSSRIRGRLLDALLDLLQRDRAGEVMKRGMMRNITEMFKILEPTVYEREFERPFIDAAGKVYRLESQQLIGTTYCADYLKDVDRRLKAETQRVSHYLPVNSQLQVNSVLWWEMAGYHMKVLVEMENSGLVSMLATGRYEDLERMYNLCHLFPIGLQIMREVMITHLRGHGKQLVMDRESLRRPVEFVQALVDEMDKYEQAMRLSFKKDETFRKILNAFFQYLFNLNARSPELFALFLNDKVQEWKSASREEVESTRKKAMRSFRYVQGKDIFVKYYQQHLANRFLTDSTVSYEHELRLIVKLEEICGEDFISNLKTMFFDIMIKSCNIMKGFNSTYSPPEGLSLVVKVLTTASWPKQTVDARCNLPTEILPLCEKFKDYYSLRYRLGHRSRNLTWQPNLGTADLEATFGNGRQYELHVSTYQMCVLMLFNSAECRLGYRQIEQATYIPRMDLKTTLHSLACVEGKNVLVKEPMTKDVNDGDVFLFNDNFVSESEKIMLGALVDQKESEFENQTLRQEVEVSRKPQIEAAVVRIMKSRVTLDHDALISEVTKQLQQIFLPNPAVIRESIRSLVEREYLLQRAESDRICYVYFRGHNSPSTII
ncbi:unnamed protein product [Calypogeia fissa]